MLVVVQNRTSYSDRFRQKLFNIHKTIEWGTMIYAYEIFKAHILQMVVCKCFQSAGLQCLSHYKQSESW